MTDIVATIVNRLKANTAICSASYVGVSPDQRIYADSYPVRPVFPNIIVEEIDDNRPTVAHNKRQNGMTRIQCTAWATKAADARAISGLIAEDLDNLQHTALTGAYIIRIHDQGGAPAISLAAGVYGRRRDFLIEHYV